MRQKRCVANIQSELAMLVGMPLTGGHLMTGRLESLVDFIDNPESRVTCVVMLDVSRSMTGEAIAEVNAGIQRFKMSWKRTS